MFNIGDFIRESNKIEGILHPPSYEELEVYKWFLALHNPLIEDLIDFVSIVQPGAVLRSMPGLNAGIRKYEAPLGGPNIEGRLGEILHSEYSPHRSHVEYELLHPFTDGNGRSGRVLWLHKMGGIEEAPLGFLHTFYYQTLERAGK